MSQFSCVFDAKQECPGGDGDEQEVHVKTTAKVTTPARRSRDNIHQNEVEPAVQGLVLASGPRRTMRHSCGSVADCIAYRSFTV